MAKESILLVEREAKTRRVLKVSLEQAGYEVTVARDGNEALKQLEIGAPAVVITATDLPKLDGYALVRRMKEHAEWARIPVVFMSAGGSIEDKIRGLELGVEEYLRKPVFVKELLGRVDVMLARRMRESLSESVADTRVAGDLRDMPPVDLFESLESGGQSGVVRISSADHAGAVYFSDGEMINAEVGRLRGEEAVFRMLCWIHGRFEVELGPIDADRIIEGKTRAVIEAGMRHAAEYNRLVRQAPPLDAVLEVQGAALVARQAEIPDEINGILELVDGTRRIHDIIDESPFDDLSTLATIAKLEDEGLLVVVGGDGPPPPPPVSRDHQRLSLSRAHDEDEDDEFYRQETTRPPASARLRPRTSHAPLTPSEPLEEAPLAAEEPLERPGEGVDPREWTADISDAKPFSQRSDPDYAPPGSELELEPAEEHEPPPPTPRRPSAPTPAPEHLPEDIRPTEPALVPAQIEGATEPREDAEAAISTPSNRHAEVAEQTDQEPEEPDDEEPDDEEPEPDDEDDEPEEELEELATTSKSPFDRAKTPSSGEPVSTRRGHRSDGDSTPPGSGGHALGESGISTGFFESFEEPGEDELPPSSKEQPVYLTDDQIARKERAKVIVAVVVGLLGAVVLYVMLFGTGGGRGTKTAPAASTTSAASETSPASATPPASASAAPAASSATAAGGAGGAKATGGEGGAAATEEGEGGTAGDEKLPDVEDPLAEVSRLLNVGNYQDAIPMGKAAIAKHPDNGDAYFYLGQAYEALGKRDEALKVYAACVDHADKGQFLSWCKRYAPKK